METFEERANGVRPIVMTGTLFLIAAVVFFAAAAPRAEGTDATHASAVVPIGTLSFTKTVPPGMVNVLGLDPEADAFFHSLDEKFKLVVIGAYAEKNEYLAFVEDMKAGKPHKLPDLAVVAITRKMPEESYDGKKTAKEMKRYVSWFTLATNTKPLAYAMELKANQTFKKKLGRDLRFAYDVGEFSKIFNRTTTSLSV
ncbi:MAG: hypothetical protein LBF41_06780, partial [Deltaproteobacteria bacterium]|nr:hypothetical protein [Deltaproteobacteria bacterium]